MKWHFRLRHDDPAVAIFDHHETYLKPVERLTQAIEASPALTNHLRFRFEQEWETDRPALIKRLAGQIEFTGEVCEPDWQQDEDETILSFEVCDLWSVAIFETSLAYGGSEEGGWYYTYGYLLEYPVIYFDSVIEARNARNLIEHWMDESDNWNKLRRPLHSVLSDGRYQARVKAGHPEHSFPSERPRYE